jgi:ABC-2 type transport system permease protein
MRNILAIFRRELVGYFATPVAYVFLVIFLLLAGMMTFFASRPNLFERGQADLQPFFAFHPWLYLFLVPAISMRLWAEERKSGTIELLLTLPVSMAEAVLGKFLAAWCFTGIALLLTVPMWITVNYLGSPDNGVIVASYLGSLLMAGGYLAIGACLSAITRNQVIAFVVSVAVCFGFVMAGFPMVVGVLKDWVPEPIVDVVASLGFLTHFDAITKGVIDAGDLVFFVSVMAFFLFANAVVLDLRKAE